jgi:hypothetical protein
MKIGGFVQNIAPPHICVPNDYVPIDAELEFFLRSTRMFRVSTSRPAYKPNYRLLLDVVEFHYEGFFVFEDLLRVENF